MRAKWRYVKADNLIEVYEIPYSTTVEAIMDKVAELIKAGKINEIADMRDETDLSGLKLTIDLKRGTDPDKLMAKLFKSDSPDGQPVLQLQHPHRRDAPGDGGAGRSWRSGPPGAATACAGAPTSALKKKQDKLHLLKGLKRILLDIDKAIHIIRETEEDAEVSAQPDDRLWH